MSPHIRSFLAAFFGGAAAIVLCRIASPDAPPWLGALLAALAAVVVIVVLGFHYRRLRIPGGSERAGDNLYYLGFLFTLISLMYALVELFLVQGQDASLAERTYILIGNFGIALLSTIAGILGRLILHDGSEDRRDPKETPRSRLSSSFSPIASDSRRTALESASASESLGKETGIDRSDIDLHSSVQRLRAELRGAADALGHYNRMTMHQAEHTRQHAERLGKEFARRLETDAQAAVTRTEDAHRDLVDHARAMGDAFEGRVKQTVDALAVGFEQLSSAGRMLSELSTDVEQARGGVEVLGRTAKAAATRLDDEAAGIREASEVLVRTTHEQRTVMAQSMEFTGTLSEAVERLGEISRSLAEVPARMEQIRIVADSMNEALNAVVVGLDDKAGEVARAGDSLARSALQQRAAIERNREIGSAFATLSGQLESVNESLAALPANAERARQSMDAFGRDVDDARGNIHLEAREVIGAFETLARSVREQQEQILEAARAVNARLDSEASGWIRSFEELRIGFGAVPRAASALAALVEQVESTTRSLAEFSADMKQIERDGTAPDDRARPAVSVPARESEGSSPRRRGVRIPRFRRKT